MRGRHYVGMFIGASLTAYSLYFQTRRNLNRKGAGILNQKWDKDEEIKERNGFVLGEWVFVDDERNNGKYIGSVGYIKKLQAYEAKVRILRLENGKKIDNTLTVVYADMMKHNNIPPMSEDEYKSKMDVALLTKDLDWCQAIQKQYDAQQKIRG